MAADRGERGGERVGMSACGCWKCLEARGEQIRHMILCADCGNKRCPHAADHDLACTASNDAGQPGSAYEAGSGVASARRFATTPAHPQEPTDLAPEDSGERGGAGE